MVAVTASVAWIVVLPETAPLMTNGIILLLVTVLQLAVVVRVSN
jgi:hypothetical protein